MPFRRRCSRYSAEFAALHYFSIFLLCSWNFCWCVWCTSSMWNSLLKNWTYKLLCSVDHMPVSLAVPANQTDRQTDGQNCRSIVLHFASVLHSENCTESFSSSFITLCWSCVIWQVCDMECPWASAWRLWLLRPKKSFILLTTGSGYRLVGDPTSWTVYLRQLGLC